MIGHVVFRSCQSCCLVHDVCLADVLLLKLAEAQGLRSLKTRASVPLATSVDPGCCSLYVSWVPRRQSENSKNSWSMKAACNHARASCYGRKR